MVPLEAISLWYKGLALLLSTQQLVSSYQNSLLLFKSKDGIKLMMTLIIIHLLFILLFWASFDFWNGTLSMIALAWEGVSIVLSFSNNYFINEMKILY